MLVALPASQGCLHHHPQPLSGSLLQPLDCLLERSSGLSCGLPCEASFAPGTLQPLHLKATNLRRLGSEQLIKLSPVAADKAVQTQTRTGKFQQQHETLCNTGKALIFTFSAKALKHPQDHMKALHQVVSMIPALHPVVKLLDEAGQDWQQAALFLVVMQQPAQRRYGHGEQQQHGINSSLPNKELRLAGAGRTVSAADLRPACRPSCRAGVPGQGSSASPSAGPGRCAACSSRSSVHRRMSSQNSSNVTADWTCWTARHSYLHLPLILIAGGQINGCQPRGVDESECFPAQGGADGLV